MTTVGTPDARLRFAIHHRRLIQFNYHGAQRIAEPHDYGVSRDCIRLLAFQLRGQSKGPLPDWRLFDVARMEQLVVLDETFRGSRARPGQSHKQWEVLFCRVE
jgi:predicted DNA-binding transcriptional regulator YafY